MREEGFYCSGEESGGFFDSGEESGVFGFR